MVWAFEIRANWVELLKNGRKTVEVRMYPLPSIFQGEKVYIVSPPVDAPLLVPNKDDPSQLPRPVSGFPDVVPENLPGALLMGWVQFGETIEYRDGNVFRGDAARHAVPPDSPFAWKDGVTEVVYGWSIKECNWLSEPQPVPAMTRHKGSIFDVSSHLP